MKEHRIEVTIDAEGRISADAEGFEDGTCVDELARLLEGLGYDESQIQRKSEAEPGRRAAHRTVQRRSS